MLVKFWFIDMVIFKMGMISLLMLGNIYIYIHPDNRIWWGISEISHKKIANKNQMGFFTVR